MIYTSRQSALSREMADRAASRECVPTCAFRVAAAAKPLISHYAAKRAYFGRRSGIICPSLASSRWPREARKAGFLGEFRDAAPRATRAVRGNINNSAELLITATGIAPPGGRCNNRLLSPSRVRLRPLTRRAVAGSMPRCDRRSGAAD